MVSIELPTRPGLGTSYPMFDGQVAFECQRDVGIVKGAIRTSACTSLSPRKRGREPTAEMTGDDGQDPQESRGWGGVFAVVRAAGQKSRVDAPIPDEDFSILADRAILGHGYKRAETRAKSPGVVPSRILGTAY
jgi:hypothetical protein